MLYNLLLNALWLKKMWDKAVNRCFFICFSEDHFPIRYVPDQYKPQQMCDKVFMFA